MTADTGLRAGSRAVLIGVSEYEDAEFPSIRAARNSLHAMKSLLTDPALCGWPPELITEIPDPDSVTDLAVRIAELAKTTAGVLLLYYVGHGVLSPRGELCLTVRSTRLEWPKITGLPWEMIAEALYTCPARIRLAILDCCFAGQAIETLGADSSQGLADITYVDGVYTLTATTRNRAAHVPPASQQDLACTSFTGELQALIRSGIPGKPSRLTFGHIFPELRRRLQAKDLPAPSQRGTNTVQQFPFTANTAAQTRRPRQARDQADALRAARSITDEESKARALADVARAVAATDPDRAKHLTAAAERAAQSITDEHWKAWALADVVKAVAATDPDRAKHLTAAAERAAQSITDKHSKAWALAHLAVAVADTDPDRAKHLTAAAEETAQSITGLGSKLWTRPGSKAWSLASLAQAAAATDPDRAARLTAEAERLARSSTNEQWKAEALADLAQAAAATDPDRAARLITEAERLARSSPWTLVHVAAAAVAIDPNRAGRIASSIPWQEAEIAANANIMLAVAATDLDRAERIARSTQPPSLRAQALASLAKAVAATDPDRAERITQSINPDPPWLEVSDNYR